MKTDSIHDVIKMKPCYASTILRNFSLKKMKRTSRLKSKHYYRGKLHNSLRVIYDYQEKTIQFIRELKCSYGTRHESLTYHYSKGIVVKEFHEPSAYDADFRKVEYPFVTDEAEHFTQSLVHDKYFPDLEDFVKMKEMLADFKQDSYDWDVEMYRKKCKRNRESAKKWEEKTGRSLTLHWSRRKSKAKPSSS